MPTLYDTKAFVLSKVGNQQWAVNNMYLAIQFQPNNAEYRLHLAEILFRSGERQKVREALGEIEKMPLAVRAMPEPVRQRLDRLRASVAGETVSAASGG